MKLLKPIWPFQITGGLHLVNRLYALLADEPGLGKTVQALWAVATLNLYNVLVICPASVVLGWKEEIVKFLGRGELYRFNIISYNKAVEEAKSRRFYDALIPDEAHYLKEFDAQRTQAVFNDDYGIARRCGRVWALTGTPILNRPRELYPTLSTMAPSILSPYNTQAKYEQRFCGSHFNGRGMDARGATHQDDLKRRLTESGFMLRRTMDEVLPQMPKAVPQIIPMQLNKEDWDIIREVENEILGREEYISTIMEQFSALGDNARLLKATGLAKVRSSVAFIKDQLETVEKVVVYAWHQDVIHNIAAALSQFNPVLHMGGISAKVKQENKARFMIDPQCRVFIGNIESSGIGLNGLQTVCRTCVFAEIVWGAGRIGQAIRRLRRMGMDEAAGRVNAYLLHAVNTVESAVFQSNEKNGKVIDFLMGEDRQFV